MIHLKHYKANNNLYLIHSTSKPSGYGHHTITVKLEYNGQQKEFKKTTNDMPAFDEATDLEGEDKELALYNIIQYHIEELIEEWTWNVENDYLD